MANPITHTILIIEDNDELQELYRQTLVGAGFRVEQAKTGHDGLVKAKLGVDLILLDIMLGGASNGFDVLEQLKRHPHVQHIPVIVLTNLDSEKAVAQKIGAAEYLVKAHIQPPDLVSIIQKHLQPVS